MTAQTTDTIPVRTDPVTRRDLQALAEARGTTPDALARSILWAEVVQAIESGEIPALPPPVTRVRVRPGAKPIPVPAALPRDVRPSGLRVWIAIKTLSLDPQLKEDAWIEASWAEVAREAGLSGGTIRGVLGLLRAAGWAEWIEPQPGASNRKVLFRARWERDR